MKKTLKTWVIEPVAFLSVYLVACLLGSVAYTVGWQFTFERGRPPNELGGWFIGSCIAAAVGMLNLCALNQLLILPTCLWPRLRRGVGFRFAILSGILFGTLPLTIKEFLRESSPPVYARPTAYLALLRRSVGGDISRLKLLMTSIASQQELPVEIRDHKLAGNYRSSP